MPKTNRQQKSTTSAPAKYGRTEHDRWSGSLDFPFSNRACEARQQLTVEL